MGSPTIEILVRRVGTAEAGSELNGDQGTTLAEFYNGLDLEIPVCESETFVYMQLGVC